ncbi:MAG: hypothetical protein COT15_00545 [Candidatus Diapherotrites archaeon CG08_land_8_20_14_0_20_34_12]|nr:MAG: hypothetical protein COT15_00545 [Candidatus Diapherotrites archaeon CG08_land_8_20_14_0_20_34_12]
MQKRKNQKQKRRNIAMKRFFLILLLIIFFSACLQDPVKFEDNFQKINSFWKNSYSDSLIDQLPIKSFENKYPSPNLTSIKKNLADFNKSLSEYSSANAKLLSEWIFINLLLADYLNDEFKFQKQAKNEILKLNALDINNLSEDTCFSGFLILSEKADLLIEKSEAINLKFNSLASENSQLINSKVSFINNSAVVDLKALLLAADSDFSTLCKFNSSLSLWINSAETNEEICNTLDLFKEEVIQLQSMKITLNKIIENPAFSNYSSSELSSAYSLFGEQADELGSLYASAEYSCNPK